MQDHEHPQRTRRNQYRYLFTAKHHGGSKGAAQWSTELSEDDEFAIFDGADDMELSDADGNLYGALRDDEDSLRDLGIWQEQIAEFPCAAEETPWHGYPVWAIIMRDQATGAIRSIARPEKFLTGWLRSG